MFRKFISGFVALAAVTLVGSAMAGDVRGPQEWNKVVGAKQQYDIAFTFKGGDTATIRVRGDGDGDIDCHVRDENDNVADTDVDDTDTCLLRVTPRRTGDFTVRVRNNGREPTLVHLWTN